MNLALKPSNVVAITDLGPDVQRERGDLVVEAVNDPEAPGRVTRRSRRQWLPAVLLLKGRLDAAEYLACQRYLDAHERGVLGAKDSGGMIYVDRSAGAGGPGDGQLAAVTDWRRARAALGEPLAEVMDWCVLGHASLAAFSAHRGCSAQEAARLFRDGAACLADHYASPKAMRAPATSR